MQYPFIFLLVSIFVLCFIIGVLIVRLRANSRLAKYWRGEYYRSQDGLDKVKRGLGKFLEDNGGKWTDHGLDCDDICYKWRDQYYLIGRGVYAIDGEEVDFFTIIAMLAQE